MKHENATLKNILLEEIEQKCQRAVPHIIKIRIILHFVIIIFFTN